MGAVSNVATKTANTVNKPSAVDSVKNRFEENKDDDVFAAAMAAIKSM